MKETKIIEKGSVSFAVTYDYEALENLRRELIDKMSVVDYFSTKSVSTPYYLPKNEYENIEIRNYHESYEPWIDVWQYYVCSYDKYVIPYLARLIKQIQEGKYEALIALLEPEYLPIGYEYIPIQETINEYSSLIANWKEYDSKFPCSQLCNREEAKIAMKNIQKYIDILLDNDYKYKFSEYYKTARKMISFKMLKKEDEAKLIRK